MLITVRNEEGQVLYDAVECPRCLSVAYGDPTSPHIPLAMTLNRAKTIHLCTLCGLMFGTAAIHNSTN